MMIRRIGDGQICCYGMLLLLLVGVVVAAPTTPKAAPLLPSLRCHVTRRATCWRRSPTPHFSLHVKKLIN